MRNNNNGSIKLNGARKTVRKDTKHSPNLNDAFSECDAKHPFDIGPIATYKGSDPMSNPMRFHAPELYRVS